MIKKLILSMLLIMPLPANAEACKYIHDLAEGVMRNRQAQTPLSDIMAVATKDRDITAEGIAVSMVNDAYSMPVAETKEEAINSIVNFSYRYYDMCLELEMKMLKNKE